MGKLTISSAFRIRNKLKERIKKLNSQIERAEVVRNSGEAENTACFDGSSFKDSLKRVDDLMQCLCKLNLAIEAANKVNKEDLISLETLKSQIALYNYVAEKCRSAEKERYVYNREGGKDKIILELVVEQAAVVQKLAALKEEKDEIEERLAESNFRTEVAFNPEEAKKLL